MRPIEFPEKNATLMPVKGTKQGKLPVCKTDKGWISCWKLSFMDRIRAVIFGHVWIYTYDTKFQYPVSMSCERTLFKKVPKPKENTKIFNYKIPKKRRK